ncbi:hypothetical protein F5887DRAFT_1059806 [Amanita rubescens]|nr:hypothetical protein F5887DRAFT_1059806 [Amanita rubescens]
MSFLVSPRLHMQPDNNPSTDQDYPDDHQPLPIQKQHNSSCYWALLNSSLDFIYLDPILSSHLADQAGLLLNKSLIDYVHPDEQASAKHDIGGVVERKTMHGSITRIRFSRLSRIRRMLGYDGPLVSLDPNYMVVDIVTNWAAEGLVLCFIHATAEHDSEDLKKSEWTNWCGTPVLDMQQIHRLYHALLMYIPQGNMTRVFQILSNSQERALLVSWPPDPVQNDPGPSGRDFAKLVETVEFGASPGLSDAKTTCARRYRSIRPLPLFADTVESIFVPHGSVIFACHRINASSRNATSTMPQAYSTSTYHPQQQQYYEQQTNFALPPLASPQTAYNGNYAPQTQNLPTSYSTQRWSAEQQGVYHQWESSAHSPSHVPTAPPPSYVDASTNSQAGFNRPISPGYSYPAVGGSGGEFPTDLVPPPRRRVSPGSTRDHYSTTSRAASNRPMGVLRCSSCKATQSPEWRKGPSGKKELCNACGLRYARSRAKKEGHNPTQRKRKEKTQVKAESTTPPNASPTYPAMRRRIGEESFSTSSTGSPSGSDIYSQSGHPVLSTLTPSPSPPANNMSFVHYSPGPNSRQQYSTATNNFYSVPSPLSNPPVLNTPHETAHSTHEQHGTQLPPLGQISSYTSRISPMLPAASSITHSPLTSTLPLASYERERDKDRELPPTPVSAEPRQPRSILTHQ